jgi:regulatory protein
MRQGYAPDVVERTLQQATAADQLDDVAFTRLWVRDRMWHHPMSRAAIARELHDKGVAADLISRTLDEEYPAVKEVELAGALADERWRRMHSLPGEKRTARLLAYLARRGFSRGLAIQVIRSVEEAIQREDE